MPESGTAAASTDGTSTATATTPENPIAANTSDFTHPVTWIDAAGDAVDAAEVAPTLDYPYLDVAGATVVEVVGRELGFAQGQAAGFAVPSIEWLADRFL